MDLRLILAVFGLLVLLASQSFAAWWRFEGGNAGQPVATTLGEESAPVATAAGEAPTFIEEVPFALLPMNQAPNHSALHFGGKGWLQVASTPELNEREHFTVEFWARFAGSPGQILASKGKAGAGNWHFIYQRDGTVQANIYGGPFVYLFDAASGGPLPGVWYHLAATYEALGEGKMRVRAYVNGNLRASAVWAALGDTSGTDLYIGSYPDGELPFTGDIDEFRFTPQVLKPSEFLIGSAQPVPDLASQPAPYFVKAGQPITSAQREKAERAPVLARPDGWTYFYTRGTGSPSRGAPPPEGYDSGFAWAMMGWWGGAAAGYHFAVPRGGKFAVAIGFYDADTVAGKRVQKVVLDGKLVDHFDVAVESTDESGSRRPFVRVYQAEDLNRDGWLEVVASDTNILFDNTALINQVWIFRAADAASADSARLVRQGDDYDLAPLYWVGAGHEQYGKGHIGYPPLPESARMQMLAPRPVRLGDAGDWPQPPDPWELTIKGELEGRIRTHMDRWAFNGRDQQLIAGHLPDCGYETAGRNLDIYSKLSRLMKVALDPKVTADALAAQQEFISKYPGSLVGGEPVRTGFIWGQSTVFTGLMEYYDLTGDAKALETAKGIADWYQYYLDNGDLWAANYFSEREEFSREGATVGHLGKGSLEAMVWLWWRTKEPRFLERAKEIAELNREWGGVAWMVHGDLPPERQQYEGWHIHANLSTVRGFVWLAAATGDKSYLDDAIAACDRVWDRATWGFGAVLEQIPWRGTSFPGSTPDPHDETCQTADELMLSLLLAENTLEGRFFDRAEHIYWNALRYSQYHYGNFTAMDRLPGLVRGGDGWFCCGWWGTKGLYEVARHIWASSPTALYVNDYLPSSVTLPVAGQHVKASLKANLPASGQVKLRLAPEKPAEFAVKLRLPSWAGLVSVKVNGKPVAASQADGYATVERRWAKGDVLEADFLLPLRVVLDNAWDTLPAGQVSVDGGPVQPARCVMVMRGPVILAQFRVNHGVDTNWAYTGDHPDLFETVNTVSEQLEGKDWKFEPTTAPTLVSVRHIPKGVLLEWSFEPAPGWKLTRTALVRDEVPVRIEYSAELAAPDGQALDGLKAARLLGIRMRTGGFVDYKKAKLLLGGKEVAPSDLGEGPLPGRQATLDNGYVQFGLKAEEGRLMCEEGGDWTGLWVLPERRDNRLLARSVLTVTGQNQFILTVIYPE